MYLLEFNHCLKIAVRLRESRKETNIEAVKSGIVKSLLETCSPTVAAAAVADLNEEAREQKKSKDRVEGAWNIMPETGAKDTFHRHSRAGKTIAHHVPCIHPRAMA